MWNGPGSERSGVHCSTHFEKDCFETSCLLAQSMGIKKKILLKPDAVPTIFPEPSPSQAAASLSSVSYARSHKILKCSSSEAEKSVRPKHEWSKSAHDSRKRKLPRVPSQAASGS